MAIEDHPVRANHEHAVAVERRIAQATLSFDTAVQLRQDVSERQDELLNEILHSHNDNLLKAHYHSDAAYVHNGWLEEHLVEMYFPSLNLLDLDDVPDPEAAKDYLDHFDDDDKEQLFEWSREQRKHDQLSMEFRSKLDRHNRRILEEFEGLRAREEPLEWDVENRRMELASAKSARGDHSTELDGLQAAIVDGVPGLGNIRYGSEVTHPPSPSQEYWDNFEEWTKGQSLVHPNDFVGMDEDGLPIERGLSGPEYAVRRMMEANDRELAKVEARAIQAQSEADDRERKLQERIAHLEERVVDTDIRPRTKYISLPDGVLVTRHRSENQNRGCNTLNKMNEQGRLIQSDPSKQPIQIYLMIPNGQKGQHTKEMLALRHGIVVTRDRVNVEVKSRMNEDQNEIYVWFPEFHKYGYVCVMVQGNGTMQCATGKFEDSNWTKAENELYPGIKQALNQYTLPQLAAIHEEIKAHLEANTVSVA